MEPFSQLGCCNDSTNSNNKGSMLLRSSQHYMRWRNENSLDNFYYYYHFSGLRFFPLLSLYYCHCTIMRLVHVFESIIFFNVHKEGKQIRQTHSFSFAFRNSHKAPQIELKSLFENGVPCAECRVQVASKVASQPNHPASVREPMGFSPPVIAYECCAAHGIDIYCVCVLRFASHV